LEPKLYDPSIYTPEDGATTTESLGSAYSNQILGVDEDQLKSNRENDHAMYNFKQSQNFRTEIDMTKC